MKRGPLGTMAAGVLWLAALGWQGEARAETTEEISLDWDGTAPCDHAEPVVERVHGLIGPQKMPSADALHVEARVRRGEDGGWTLTMHFSGTRAQGTRRLRADSCAAVQRVASLLIALVIDPELLRQDVVKQGNDAVESPLDTSSAPNRPPHRSSSSDRSAPVIHGSAGASLVVAAGPLPEPSFGPAVHTTIGAYGFRARLQAAYLPPRNTDLPTRAPARSRFDLLSASIQLMRLFELGPVRVGPYAGLQVGRLFAQATGLIDAHDEASLWLALETGFSSLWSITPWFALRGDVGFDIALRRARFVVGGVGEIYRPSPVSERATLGVAFTLY